MVRASKLELYGSSIKIYYENDEIDLAIPTGQNIFIVTTNEGPTPEPTGDYSWPYSLSYVTSEFGPRGSGFHEGMDWSGGPASAGQPIPCIGNGTVHQILPVSSGFGNAAIIYHGLEGGLERYSLYAHMSTAPIVSVGATVTKGQNLGPIGNTGNSFGAHLHMEIHKVQPGGSLVWDNNNPSWTSNRTAQDPRVFMRYFGDGGVLIP